MISVIFDMDGTLLDTQKICIPAWEYAGREQGVVGMGDHIVHVCGMNSAGWSRYVLDRYPHIDMDKFNLTVREYVLEHGKITYKKGAEELLSYLWDNKIKTAIASGSSIGSIEHHLREVGSYERFDAIAGGVEVEHGKPAPDVFLLAAKRMGAEPCDCIVFEDSENGIRAAHAAGMSAIGIADIVPFSDEVKDLMYAEFSDMTESLELMKTLIEK